MRPRCCWPRALAPGPTACLAGAPVPGRRRAHVPAPALTAARAAAAAGLGSVACVSVGACRLRAATAPTARRSRRRLEVSALVAVDYSQPAIWLGLGLIGGGLSLYQLRRVQPVLSRDFDIVVSSVVIFSGGILIFQGWRLDPLLLFCQLLTAGTALAWALEAIKLRRLVENDQRFDERARRYPPLKRGDGYGGDEYGGRGLPLPPPREADFGRWYGPAGEQEPLYGEELPTASGQPQYYGGGGAEPWEGGGSYYARQPEGGSYHSPPEAGRAPDADGAVDPRWGPVDDVESYYNRPGNVAGSVTEDVARYYGGGEPPGQPEAGAAAQARAFRPSTGTGGAASPPARRGGRGGPGCLAGPEGLGRAQASAPGWEGAACFRKGATWVASRLLTAWQRR